MMRISGICQWADRRFNLCCFSCFCFPHQLPWVLVFVWRPLCQNLVPFQLTWLRMRMQAVLERTTRFPWCLSSGPVISLWSQAELDPNFCALNYPRATACPLRGLGQWLRLPAGDGTPSPPNPTTPLSRKETERSEQAIEAEAWTPHTPWVSLVWSHLRKLGL